MMKAISMEFPMDKDRFVSNRTEDPDKNENTDIFIIEAKPGAVFQQTHYVERLG